MLYHNNCHARRFFDAALEFVFMLNGAEIVYDVKLALVVGRVGANIGVDFHLRGFQLFS